VLFSAYGLPLTVYRLPFTVYRLPFTALNDALLTVKSKIARPGKSAGFAILIGDENGA